MAAMPNRVASQKHNVLEFDKDSFSTNNKHGSNSSLYQKLSVQYGTTATQNCLLSAKLLI